MRWISAYSHLFNILDKSGTPAYHSGSAFIKVVQQFDRGLPGYSLYIEERNRLNQSTTRRDFYWDILQNLDESIRFEVFRAFIDIVEPHFPTEAQDLRAYMFGYGNPVPKASIPNHQWSSDKLNSTLSKIDNAIDTSNYNNAMTLAYTCLEGLYKSYVKKHIPTSDHITDLMPLSKLVRTDIDSKLSVTGSYPAQMVTSISTLTSAIANSRNSFSDSHFDNDANKWLAIYSRDLVNSIGRLLLHFL
ncbi:hypothetical protein AB9R81_00585 [Vibrio cyclitrophicus]|uniref:hypothetical protein n=1 Tax=Vibrio TaxID=662 RepID=UPI0002DB03DE|nr:MULTISPECIES: hypothetical protein [Vibrio]MBY7660210.1 hypothetical protein [Vibrio atlanticus]MBE8555012.1 hypothetical protein [Vibrio sp. OPT24]NOH18585.1 hypothetical protein [Vibrio cyclitrophicus]OED69986.1 hypothetical protein OAU_08080 [Vibrio cyclitrophicus ZF99]OEF40673.1 hypothetical protein OAE_02235 [Vibrio cyclitrophicus 1F289]|tara:strand:- start:1189 stop:1926 length:738 start_codon:yes stop_codon:yes gene_type:complete